MPCKNAVFFALQKTKMLPLHFVGAEHFPLENVQHSILARPFAFDIFLCKCKVFLMQALNILLLSTRCKENLVFVHLILLKCKRKLRLCRKSFFLFAKF